MKKLGGYFCFKKTRIDGKKRKGNIWEFQEKCVLLHTNLNHLE